MPGLDVLRQVAVRRGDDADVDLPAPVLADATHLALLERAEELRLEAQRHLADLVEEERPAVGRLEEAGPVGGGAGEGAAHVAEELALEEALREGRAVDGDERTRRPGATARG